LGGESGERGGEARREGKREGEGGQGGERGGGVWIEGEGNRLNRKGQEREMQRGTHHTGTRPPRQERETESTFLVDLYLPLILHIFSLHLIFVGVFGGVSRLGCCLF
jgi:hypothetical protein